MAATKQLLKVPLTLGEGVFWARGLFVVMTAWWTMMIAYHLQTLLYPSIAARQLQSINITVPSITTDNGPTVIVLSDYMHGIEQISMYMDKPSWVQSQWIKYGLVPVSRLVHSSKSKNEKYKEENNSFGLCSRHSTDTFCSVSAGGSTTSTIHDDEYQYKCYPGSQTIQAQASTQQQQQRHVTEEKRIWRMDYFFYEAPVQNKALIAVLCYDNINDDRKPDFDTRTTTYRLVWRVKVERPSWDYYVFDLGLMHFMCWYLWGCSIITVLVTEFARRREGRPQALQSQNGPSERNNTMESSPLFGPYLYSEQEVLTDQIRRYIPRICALHYTQEYEKHKRTRTTRVLQELRAILSENNPFPGLTVAPRLVEDRYIHFVLEGPADTPWQGGLFTGKILIPPDYPFHPPAKYIMMTPSGKEGFQAGQHSFYGVVGKWNPATTGLRDYLGYVVRRWYQVTTQKRERLIRRDCSVETYAEESLQSSATICPHFQLLFPQFIPTAATAAESSGLDNDDESYAMVNDNAADSDNDDSFSVVSLQSKKDQ